MNVLVNENTLSAIADSIRAKGVSGTFKPAEMATAISNIKVGSPALIVGNYSYFDESSASFSGTKLVANIGTISGTKVIFD